MNDITPYPGQNTRDVGNTNSPHIERCEMRTPDFFTEFERLEARLFDKKQRGKFLVFPPSVLGMASFYALPPHCHLQFSGCEQQTLGETLWMPDLGSINTLKYWIGFQEAARLREFYERVGMSGYYREGNFRGSNLGRPRLTLRTRLDTVTATNHFAEGLEVVHNGVKLHRYQTVFLNSEDILRIGPSILFAYLRKD